MTFLLNDTIVALATAHGSAAIAVIRLSGANAVKIADLFFYSRGLKKKSLTALASQTTAFGVMYHNGIVLDEVLITISRKPGSYTGEDTVEVSCHGSIYIQQQLLQLFLYAGARMAEPGEFTMRAFINGKLDLSQAEAVADLVASNSPLSHRAAIQQMRGGFGNNIKNLRENLIDFASLIELELDFAEEDVEFANRNDLKTLVNNILATIENLIKSFELGNVIKNGVPVAIVGRPNAGKSTLLNVLLNEERAIVSDIPGTTRDTIEDEITIEGIRFRFIDTAGLRNTSDVIEQIGVNRAIEAMRKSAVVVYLFDVHELSYGDLLNELDLLKPNLGSSQLLIVANKIDTEGQGDPEREFVGMDDVIFLSAREQHNIEGLKKKLVQHFESRTHNMPDTIVTNARHAHALALAGEALHRVKNGLENNVAGDLLALDIRYALNELGNITGQVSSNDLLENIFSRFCIGK